MRTKIIEVQNITKAYAAVGTMNTISSNNCVVTNTAKVPFVSHIPMKYIFFVQFPMSKILQHNIQQKS